MINGLIFQLVFVVEPTSFRLLQSSAAIGHPAADMLGPVSGVARRTAF
jgi:hypothetical protein